ncbi:hypothetical protein TCAL_17396 [Tigriopus californicus]|uniref:Alpha-1,4-N-acetylglucosaminyltransferase n=2 Tax=Tigriopus californicus TaxID=6832 RepID=A0A553PK30_TIGCA|nr:hypothetical protein TCAL_17396 [Tigriopus californicus]|eukprot:TCALIF_06476-PA protein Name:"Protein of unknown function" AED:0.27 eAED:0.27 QI:0/-1/0/1/-1/1/1/0/326
MLKSLSCKLTAKSFLWPLFIVSFLLLLLILYYCTQIEISHNLDGLQSGPNSDHPCATHSAAFQDHFVVPNHVHFVHFNTPNFSFVSFVCIASALINHRPERVIIHTNVNTTELDQDRFVRVLRRNFPLTVEFRTTRRPTHVFGVRLGSAFHATDVYRLHVAVKEGGIFLDQDTFVVQSLDPLRYYPAVVGWPEGQFVGTQALFFEPQSYFGRVWLESYRDYRPSLWYYNSGELLTTTVLRQCPDLVHREPVLLGVQGLAHELYEMMWDQWRKYYTVHLLFRHREYLTPGDQNQSGIMEFDEVNVWNYNHTFGAMARQVLSNIQDFP